MNQYQVTSCGEALVGRESALQKIAMKKVTRGCMILRVETSKRVKVTAVSYSGIVHVVTDGGQR